MERVAISESVLLGANEQHEHSNNKRQMVQQEPQLSTEPFNAAGAIESNTAGGKETGSIDMVSKIAATGQEKHIPAQNHECFKGVDTIFQSIETVTT